MLAAGRYPGDTGFALAAQTPHLQRRIHDPDEVVRFKVADPAWLAREVLRYGAEAEVVGPESLREAVRSAVS